MGLSSTCRSLTECEQQQGDGSSGKHVWHGCGIRDLYLSGGSLVRTYCVADVYGAIIVNTAVAAPKDGMVWMMMAAMRVVAIGHRVSIAESGERRASEPAPTTECPYRIPQSLNHMRSWS